DFIAGERIRGRSARCRCGQLAQARRRTAQYVAAGPFGGELPVLQQPHRESWKVVDHRGLDRARLPDDQSSMEAERGDEIRRLILPCREHAVDDFEPERDPLACVECLGRLERGAFSPRATLKWSGASFQLEYDFGLDLRRVHP